MKKHFLLLVVVFLACCHFCSAQSFFIKNNPQKKEITIGNSSLKLVLNYNQQCSVSKMDVNGLNVMEGNTGIFSEIQTGKNIFSTLHLKNSPLVKSGKRTVEISDIVYGENEGIVNESWKFFVSDSNIQFSITRNFPKSFEAESVSFPAFEFNNINTWEGAFQGFGGIAWFYLFNEKLMTYGTYQ